MRKKICFCIDSLKIGGAERLLVDLINFWDESWDIYLVTFFAYDDLLPQVTKGKIINHVIFGAECTRLNAALKMFKFCKQENIGAVLCHLERPNKWLAIGARLAGVGVVDTVHSINMYSDVSKLKRLGLRTLYNLVPQRVVAISDSVWSYLINMGIYPRKLKLIPNGIDSEGLPKKYLRPEPKCNMALVVLARLEPVKAIDNLLKALAIFERENSLWSLRVIGDGSQRHVLENLARELGIRAKIDFVGAQNEPLRYLRDRAAVCMPSHREGLPIALLESLSVGLPAIVSNVGYLPEIVVDGKNGFVCEAGSIESLVQSLRKLDSLSLEQWLQLSKEAQESVKSYDIKTCVSQYLEVMDSLVAG